MPFISQTAPRAVTSLQLITCFLRPFPVYLCLLRFSSEAYSKTGPRYLLREIPVKVKGSKQVWAGRVFRLDMWETSMKRRRKEEIR